MRLSSSHRLLRAAFSGARAVAALVVLGALPACTTEALPSPPAPLVALFSRGGAPASQRAQAYIGLLGARKFEEAASWFDDTMRGELSPSKLSATWNRLTARGGALLSTGEIQAWPNGVRSMARATTTFERGTLDVTIMFDARGRVAGLWFGTLRPTEAPP
jgi:hypothetical protein